MWYSQSTAKGVGGGRNEIKYKRFKETYNCAANIVWSSGAMEPLEIASLFSRSLTYKLRYKNIPLSRAVTASLIPCCWIRRCMGLRKVVR